MEYIEETAPLTDEQWQRAIDFHRKQMGRSVQAMEASEQTQLYIERLATISGIERQRLLYGQWIADECADCHTTENVTPYADTAGKWKEPLYLCDKCFAVQPGRKHLREWRRT